MQVKFRSDSSSHPDSQWTGSLGEREDRKVYNEDSTWWTQFICTGQGCGHPH